MTLLELLDAAARRSQRRWELRQLAKAQRVAAGLTRRSLVADFGVDAKFLIAVTVIGLFAWAYASNVDDDTMKGALIAAFAGAWGFYLGSSNAASERRASEGKALDVAASAVAALPTPTTPDAAGKAATDVAAAAADKADEIKGEG